MDAGKDKEGFMFFDKRLRYFPSRQPIPLVTWNLLSKISPSAHWLASGVMNIQNRPILISIRFEDTLVWTNLPLRLKLEKPMLVISIANLWWNLPSAQMNLDTAVKNKVIMLSS